MKKNINLKTIIFCAILAIGVSCDDDNVAAVVSTSDYPIATFEVDGVEVEERDGTVVQIEVTIDKQIKQNITFDAIQTGGTAEEGVDFDIVGANLNAYSNVAYIDIIIYHDIEVEGDETIELQVTTPNYQSQYLLNPETVLPSITLNIKDYAFCLWTLDSSDTYGDGWNGAFVLLDSEGVQTQYATDGSQTLFDIPVTVGADYTFTYVSGGGTGGAPGYESENYYLLTAPDGTEFEDGTQDYSGIPTPGEITSGTSSCN